MTPRVKMPHPSHDPTCRGQQHEPHERIALAATLCGERGARLTALRRTILELLWSQGSPMGAYELMGRLKSEIGRPIGPPTIYRALDFLMAQGLVTRIESRNAYVPCAHPERKHDCMFFICSNCGASAELEDPRIEQLLSEHASVLGFSAARRVIEVEGACARCIAAGAA